MEATAKRLGRIEEAAQRLGVSEWRAYDMARRDLIPVVRLGRSIRVDMLRLEQFIENGGTPQAD